jgi:hypothetical protein
VGKCIRLNTSLNVRERELLALQLVQEEARNKFRFLAAE